MISFGSDTRKTLVEHFPYSDFRGSQFEVIQSLKSGKSVLCLMPTGMGKSLCYQFPAKLSEGLVLVVSPLIALMNDQVKKARALQIRSACLHSAMDKKQRESVIEELNQSRLKLLFVTPERFRKSDFLTALKKNSIELFVVDEAHCISQWGHDFRPDYAKLGEVRASLGNPQTLALTATATLHVQQDILKSLRLSNYELIAGGIERPNLAIAVEDLSGADSKMKMLKTHIENQPGVMIIYFSLIQTLKQFHSELEKLPLWNQRKLLVYHGDLPANIRVRMQKEFQSSDSAVMLATPAFGLGVDKANVREVVHAEIPGSIEAYFQEIGRAGRDGQPSSCVLLYDEDDVSIQMEFLKWAFPEAEILEQVCKLIEANSTRVQQEGIPFLREQISFKNRRDFRADSAIRILERYGVLDSTESSIFPYKLSEEDYRNKLNQAIQMEASGPGIKAQQMKLLDLVRWINQDADCRMNLIYRYFGYDHKAPCGVCDVCAG